MDKKRIGRYIKQLRKEHRYSQNDLVNRIEELMIDPSQVSKWERGDVSIDTLKLLSEVFEISIDELVSGKKPDITPLEEKYFSVRSNWCMDVNENEIYEKNQEQRLLIKNRAKELVLLLMDEGMTPSEVKEFDFLFTHFFDIQDEIEPSTLRFEIRRKALTMRNKKVNEKYWEVQKLFLNKDRLEFKKDVWDYEDDVESFKKKLTLAEPQEKDILLAQIQTHNVTHRYGGFAKKIYAQQFGKYDEERITKNAIRIMIENGAMLNNRLLGFEKKIFRKEPILDRMEELFDKWKRPIVTAYWDDEQRCEHFVEIENMRENRLFELFQVLNLKKPWIDYPDFLNLFNQNREFPEDLLLEMYDKDDRLPKKEETKEEKLLSAKDIFFRYELQEWEKAQKREEQAEREIKELQNLEKKLYNGETVLTTEYKEWVGGKNGELDEEYIRSVIQGMDYQTYLSSRDEEKTKNLLNDLERLSLDEIRRTYFTKEVRNG